MPTLRPSNPTRIAKLRRQSFRSGAAGPPGVSCQDRFRVSCWFEGRTEPQRHAAPLAEAARCLPSTRLTVSMPSARGWLATRDARRGRCRPTCDGADQAPAGEALILMSTPAGKLSLFSASIVLLVG